MDRRQFIARAGATGAIAAAGIAGFDGLAAADQTDPGPGPDGQYFPGPDTSAGLDAQYEAAQRRNAAVGAALKAAGITHVVVAMMENRSFDHLLHWLPGADGRADMAYAAPDGNVYPNYPLGARGTSPDFQGCGYSDQDHSWEGWNKEANGGKLDGFLQTSTWGAFDNATHAEANTFSIGWYGPEDVPVMAALAQNYTVCDRYFCSFQGETYPNRFYQHSGATDRDHNSGGPTAATLPAIWDQLTPATTPAAAAPAAAAGKVSGAYYFKDIPYLALWGQKYVAFAAPFDTTVSAQSFTGFDSTTKIPTAAVNSAVRPSAATGFGPMANTSFVDMATNGSLPNVVYIDPAFLDEGNGTSGDWHPLCDVRVGDAFLADIYHALADYGPEGPVLDAQGNPTGARPWLDTTVLVINFDEWGGFYDHVLPPKVTDVSLPGKVSSGGDALPASDNTPTHPSLQRPDFTQCGFRVPAIVVSNCVPAGAVSSTQFDHSSVLTMIESLFGLTPVVPWPYRQGVDPNDPAKVPAGAVGVATRDNFANNIGEVVTLTKARTDRPAVPTSTALAAAGRPIDGRLQSCSGTSEAVSKSPLPIGSTSSWSSGYGPATRPGVVPVAGSPTTGLPETPVAVAAPLAAAALAGFAVKKHFDRHRAADTPETTPADR